MLTTHVDHRGDFTEVFSRDWDGYAPVQWSVVRSKPGVFRGMHLHFRHDEAFAVVSGRAYVGLRDIRPESPTCGIWSLYQLCGEELARIAFPGGILHGWYLAEATCHLQGVSETWAQYAVDDNLGCHWADPELGIPWPATTAILSERAASHPSLRELLAHLAARRAAP